MTTPVRVTGPNTTSTELVYATVRQVLIAYVHPDTRVTLEQLLSASSEDRVWVRAMPSPAKFPYVALRLSRANSGASNSYRERAQLEIQVVGRPESQGPLVMSIADLVDAAFLGYKEPTSGLMFSRERTRDTVPQFGEPADKNVVVERLVFDLVIWPLLLLNLRPNL